MYLKVAIMNVAMTHLLRVSRISDQFIIIINADVFPLLLVYMQTVQ